MAMQSVRALIVEDDPIAAHYLRRIVENTPGFRVIAAVGTADEARAVIETRAIDVVMMDVYLRGSVNGDALAIEIHREFPEILIVFATAYSDEGIVQHAARAEAFGYLLKPYRPDEIAATLQLAKAAIEKRREKGDMLGLVDGYRYDLVEERLLKGDETILLTSAQKRLVSLLAHNHHIALETQALTEALEMSEEALRALIYRTRKETSKDLIRSIKRYGYKIAFK
jgi:response regulator of citrate/malate metabolism